MEASPIECSEQILGGTAVFRGTRVPVRTLIDYLKAGDRLDDFLSDFPTVTREQAVAALELAGEALRLHARALLRRGEPVARLVGVEPEARKLPSLVDFRSGLKVEGAPLSEEVVRAREDERY